MNGIQSWHAACVSSTCLQGLNIGWVRRVNLGLLPLQLHAGPADAQQRSKPLQGTVPAVKFMRKSADSLCVHCCSGPPQVLGLDGLSRRVRPHDLHTQVHGTHDWARVRLQVPHEKCQRSQTVDTLSLVDVQPTL